VTVQVDKESLLRQHLTSGYNLFAGAGFSVLAHGRTGPLPIGSQFAEMIRSAFGIDQNKRLTLPQVYAIAERTHPDELRDLVTTTYRVVRHDDRYSFLRELPPKSILTTNVDDLFHRIFVSDPRHFLNDVYQVGSPRSRETAIDVVQVHGYINDKSRALVFGPFDLAAAASNDPDRWHYIREKISTTPTLFWGYGFADSGTLQAMRSASGVRPVLGDAWVQLRPDPGVESLVEYYRALDYNVIIGDTDQLLDYMKTIPRTTDKSDSYTHDLGNIPTISQVPTRPIEDFFAGAAPTWSDVLGDRVHRTSHYAEIADRIAAGSNIVLAGIPGCGKTTLLMQIGAHFKTRQPKAYYENLGLAEARMLSNRIGDQELLLLLDNVASDIRVLEEIRNPNVTVVGADRDFPISSVRHRLSDLDFEVVGVTNQSRQDLVSVWKTIPERTRRQRLSIPKTTWGLEPSLYEFVKENVRHSFLSDRLLQHLREISSDDQRQAELLVLSCYLMYARSSLSTDLALAFFRDEDMSYDELLQGVADVGDLLHEDMSLGEDQDYFTARSALIAEELLDGCSASLLREVLNGFHQRVSSTRIPQFDVFRRRGYDAKIFAHAFRSANEGADLYDLIMAMDPSPYVLQQKALFLSRHARHEEAFSAIDEARNTWRGRRNWTIENTYNKVLFDANIEKVQSHPEAIDLCRRAMTGLERCFEGDLRKGQHALIYSNCALRLSEADTISVASVLEYLRRSEEMLRSVRHSEPYLDRPKYLIREVQRRIGQFG